MRLRKRKPVYSLGYCAPTLILYSVLFILPSVIGLVMAFTNWSIRDIFDFRFTGLENFQRIFQSKLFPTIMKNTFYYAIVTIVFKNLIGFVLAVLLDNSLRATKFYRTVYFMPAVLSSMIVCLIFNSIYNPQSGIINELLRALNLDGLTRQWLSDKSTAMNAICVIEIWQWSGFHMTIYLAALQSIPAEYFEAAAIDGASRWQQLMRIKVPMILDSVSINLVLSLVGGLRVFDKVYATTGGGPNNATQVFSVYMYKIFGDGLIGEASAYNLMFTIIIIVLSFAVLWLFKRKEVA